MVVDKDHLSKHLAPTVILLLVMLVPPCELMRLTGVMVTDLFKKKSMLTAESTNSHRAPSRISHRLAGRSLTRTADSPPENVSLGRRGLRIGSSQALS